MKVNKVIEKEDGNDELEIELTQEEVQLLLQYALTDLLTKNLKKPQLLDQGI